LRTLFWTMLLIFATAYAFGIVATLTIGSHSLDPSLEATHLAGLEEERVRLFGTVTRSIATCFRCFIGDCSTAGGRPIAPLFAEAVGIGCWIVYAVLTMAVSFGLFNIVAAIFVDNTMQATAHDQVKNRRRKQVEKVLIMNKIQELMQRILRHHQALKGEEISTVELTGEAIADFVIVKDIFESALEDEQTIDLLDEIGVAEADHVGLFDMLDVNRDGTVQGTELVEGILWLRGGVHKSDTIAIRLMIRAMMSQVQEIDDRLYSRSAH